MLTAVDRAAARWWAASATRSTRDARARGAGRAARSCELPDGGACRRASSRSAASRWSPTTPGRRCRGARRSTVDVGARRRTRRTTRPRTASSCRPTVTHAGQAWCGSVGDVDAALAGAAKRGRGRVLRAAPRRTRRWSRRPRSRASSDGRCEVWALTQDPQTARKEVAQALGIAASKRHGPRDAPRRRLRPQVEARLRRRGGAARRGRRARRCACSGRARTTSSTATTTRSARSASRPASTPSRKLVAWRHRTASRRSARPSTRRPTAVGLGAGQGFIDLPLDVPDRARRERAGARARAHRLAALGLRTSTTRSPCGSFDRRAGRTPRARSAGLPARS